MDEISKAIKGARAAQVGRIYGSFSNAQQVSSDDDSIRKGNEEDIEKARSGVYADTAENRRLGRVGQKYGEGKKFSDADKVLNAINKVAGSGNLSKETVERVSEAIQTELSNHGYKKISNGKFSNGEDEILLKISDSGNEKYPYKISASKTKIEKSEDDELNPFEKAAEEADMEKSDIMDALSYQGDIKVSKTGKEIKDQVDTVLLPAMTADLAVKEAEAEKELKNCGTAPTNDPDKWWTADIKMDCGFKVYDWEETYVPSNDGGKMMSSLSAEDAEDKKGNVPENQEQANCRRAYNDIVRAICNIKVDIKACEILKTLKDEKQFELSPRQVLSLRF